MAGDINQGGRAFPWCGDLNETPTIELGMTLRNYLAAKAMAGMCSGKLWPDANDYAEIARRSYAMADAMLQVGGAA